MSYLKACQLGGLINNVPSGNEVLRLVCSSNCINCNYRAYQWCIADRDVDFKYVDIMDSEV